MSDGLHSSNDGASFPIEDEGTRSFPIRPDGVIEARPLQSARENPSDPAQSQEATSRDFDGLDLEAPEAEDPLHVTLVLRDGLDVPIAGLELFVNWPDGSQCRATTSAEGIASVEKPSGAGGQARVDVVDVTGTRQQVCTLDTGRCKGVAIVRSPKVALKLPLREHQQAPPPAKRPTVPTSQPAKSSANIAQPVPSAVPAKPDKTGLWWLDSGAIDRAWTWLKNHVGVTPPSLQKAGTRVIPVRTLNQAGQPLTIAPGTECPNKDNLRLGRNNIYREAILQAARRLGLRPQAICALIDCEAAKVVERIPVLDAKQQPIKDKKGRPIVRKLSERWNANSGNAETNAAGLTQFLRNTWLGHVMLPGRYVHEKSIEAGWVRQEVITSGKKKGRLHWVFVLSDGRTTPSPASHKADANVQACLAKRMDPVWSVMAAADYGKTNLDLLERSGLKLAGLTDMDKAKLMYVMHHEGEGAGPLFIQNRLKDQRGGVQRVATVLAMQLGKNGAAKARTLIERAGGDAEAAYRKWLGGYVDTQFGGSTKYFCSSPQAPQLLSDLLVSIGGVAIQ